MRSHDGHLHRHHRSPAPVLPRVPPTPTVRQTHWRSPCSSRRALCLRYGFRTTKATISRLPISVAGPSCSIYGRRGASRAVRRCRLSTGSKPGSAARTSWLSRSPSTARAWMRCVIFTERSESRSSPSISIPRARDRTRSPFQACPPPCSSTGRAEKSPAKWVLRSGTALRWCRSSSAQFVGSRPAKRLSLDEHFVRLRLADELRRWGDLVPLALRVAADPGLRLVCCGRRPDGRTSETGRGTPPQSFLRPWLLDRVRGLGRERDDYRSTAPFLSPGGKSGRRGHRPTARPVHAGTGEALVVATRVSTSSEPERRTTRCRLHHRGRVRLRLDTVYWAGARRDPDHERCRRDGAAGRHTPGFLLARVGPTVSRRSRIHRQFDAAAQRSSSAWPKPATRRGHSRRRHGHRYPDGGVDEFFPLAARHLSDSGKDRVTRG